MSWSLSLHEFRQPELTEALLLVAGKSLYLANAFEAKCRSVAWWRKSPMRVSGYPSIVEPTDCQVCSRRRVSNSGQGVVLADPGRVPVGAHRDTCEPLQDDGLRVGDTHEGGGLWARCRGPARISGAAPSTGDRPAPGQPEPPRTAVASLRLLPQRRSRCGVGSIQGRCRLVVVVPKLGLNSTRLFAGSMAGRLAPTGPVSGRIVG